MRPTKTQQSNDDDSDEVMEAMKAASKAVCEFEKQLILYVDYNVMYPDSNTDMIKKLKRLDTEYLKLLKSVSEKIGD